MIAVSDTGTGIPAGFDRAGVRSLLHHQGGRQGHRPRAQHGVRLRQAVRRTHQDLQRGRPRHEREDLPAALERRAGDRVEALQNVPIAGGDEKILIVEDDALVRQYVVTQIKSLGYTALEAANAAEALDIIDADKGIDLLFTDVIMPGDMNGRQLADEAAAAAARPEDAVHLGLYRERHRPSRPARFRRAAAGKALPQVRARQDAQDRAWRLSVRHPAAISLKRASAAGAPP